MQTTYYNKIDDQTEKVLQQGEAIKIFVLACLLESEQCTKMPIHQEI